MTASAKNLKNLAYQAIKNRLINCEYPPGSFLNEQQLATELGFSRTPIREAISQLEFDHLVQVVPKKGILVSDISLVDVYQIFQTRIEIEPLTLKLAAPTLPIDELQQFREKFMEDTTDIQNGFRLDTAMHLFIIEHCGNRYIINMMQKVFEDNTRVIISSKQNQLQIHDAKREHLEIIDTLIARDFDHASSLMRSHVESCRQAALDYFYSIQAFSTPTNATYKSVLEQIR